MHVCVFVHVCVCVASFIEGLIKQTLMLGKQTLMIAQVEEIHKGPASMPGQKASGSASLGQPKEAASPAHMGGLAPGSAHERRRTTTECQQQQPHDQVASTPGPRDVAPRGTAEE